MGVRKRCLLLDGYQPDLRIEPFQIEWVARDHRIPCDLRADYDVRIGDVRGSGLPEQRACGLSMRSVQRDYLGPLKLDYSLKTHLPGGVPNDLRQSRGWNDDSTVLLQSGIKSQKHPAVVPFQRDQSTGVENDSVHAAFRGLPPRFRAESIRLAHARSLGLGGPPVAFSPSSIMARNAAAFSRDFWTAC